MDVVDDEELDTQVTLLKRYLYCNGITYGPVTWETGADHAALRLSQRCSAHYKHYGRNPCHGWTSGSFGFCCQHAHGQNALSWKGFRSL